jgi:hypothetical protein
VLSKKYACITLDVEEDYGDRVKEFNIYKDSIDKIEEFASSDLVAEIMILLRKNSLI